MSSQRQFYGGTSDWRRATPLTIRSGEQLRGIDLQLVPSASFPIRGRVTGLPNVADPSARMTGPATISLTAAEAWQNSIHQGTGINLQDGTFHLPAVPAGRYRLTAHVATVGKALFASQLVDLVSDPGEVVLALSPAVSLNGKVSAEGSPSVPFQDMTVELIPGRIPIHSQAPFTTKPRADGTFVFPAVPPGIWEIRVKPIPTGGYVKSMRIGEQDVLTEEMEIGTSVRGTLNIVVSSRGATVSGQVAEQPDQASAAVVVLAPADNYKHVLSFYSVARTSHDGKYELTGLTPGKYRLFAIEMLRQDLELRNPDLLAKLAAESQPVDLQEGAAVTVSPPLIRAERVQEVLR